MCHGGSRALVAPRVVCASHWQSYVILVLLALVVGYLVGRSSTHRDVGRLIPIDASTLTDPVVEEEDFQAVAKAQAALARRKNA